MNQPPSSPQPGPDSQPGSWPAYQPQSAPSGTPPTSYPPQGVPPNYPPQGSAPNYPPQGPGYPPAGGPGYQAPGGPGLPPTNYPGQSVAPAANRNKLLIIGAAVLAVVIIGLVIFFATRPSGPPSNWLATLKQNGESGVYYIHWTNQDGKLTGSFDVFGGKPGATQSFSFPFTGTYNSQDNSVVLNMNGSSIASSSNQIKGKINGDTLTFEDTPGSTSKAPVFHASSDAEFNQAKQDIQNGK